MNNNNLDLKDLLKKILILSRYRNYLAKFIQNQETNSINIYIKPKKAFIPIFDTFNIFKEFFIYMAQVLTSTK